MRPTVVRIALIIFVSGFCSLVYQVAWLRLLRLIFGASTASTAVVLAIFMGGLGLGGAWLGRRVERVPNPLAFYAWLEIGIALAAAASPLLISLARAAYVALGGVEGLGMGGATAVRLVLSVLILGVPTTLMGGTLPAVAQAIERERDRGRRLVATLYGVNTFGAVLGAFLTTFVLLELLGINRSLWLASACNLILAMVVRGMARRANEAAETEDSTTVMAEARAETVREPSAVSSPRGDTPPVGTGATRLVLGAAFFVGFIFFLMEIVWYRMLAPVLGGSSYTFGLILTVALCGIAAGGALYGRGAESRRPTLGALAWTCNLEALALIVPYALGDDLALAAAVLRQLDAVGFTGLVLSWTVVTMITVLPAAIVAGYQFPLLVALLGSGRDHVGSQVGLAYAWNTWGAIVGSLAGGFGLIPLLTAPRLWWLSALSLIVLGVLLAVLDRHRCAPRRLLAVAATALVVLVLCLAQGPTAFWRHTPIGAGRTQVDIHDPNLLRDIRHRVRRAVHREADGIESSVALMQMDELVLLVNGKSDGSARSDAPTMVMSGLVGGLLHPEPKRALVIGLGTGTTAGWLAQIDSIEQVDVVEIEPAVGRFAQDFAPITFDVLANPKVRLYYGDGREHVLTTAEGYDLIMSEPSNPYRAGVADLFSQDFYRALVERLRPGGIFLQWLQGYELDADLLRTVYATLGSVFPHLETWQVHVNDLLFVASRDGVVHDLERIRRDAQREPFASALRWVWRVEGAEGFYSGFVGDVELARRLAAEAGPRVSSDDRPLIEFGFARNVGRAGLMEISQLQTLAVRLGVDRPPVEGDPPLDWDAVREARQIRTLIASFVEARSDEPLPRDHMIRRAARATFLQGDLAGAERLWHSQEGRPTWPLDRLILAEAVVERAGEEADAWLEQLRLEAPTESRFLEARLAFRRGDVAGAAAHLAEALLRLRDDVWVYRPVVQRGLELASSIVAADPSQAGRLFEALDEPFPALLLERQRRANRVHLSRYIPDLRACVAVFTEHEPYPIWQRDFLETRFRCYEAASHELADEARGDLEDFLTAAPSVDVGLDAFSE